MIHRNNFLIFMIKCIYKEVNHNLKKQENIEVKMVIFLKTLILK